MNAHNTLRINEIFFSLQGETTLAGLPTVFIRLTGCPLRCQYCDTAYAFHAGRRLNFDSILQQVASYPARYITVSGGEPLAQPNCLPLLKQLCEKNYVVSLETSGALDVSQVDQRVIKILDVKTPGSGEVERNLYQNFNYLNQQDQIKFVICHREDYEWAKQIINQYQLLARCTILLSPSYQQIENDKLADWILQDGLPVRFQLQMHKYIWGDVAGR